jgi:UV DNA damage repair endonuclease
VFHVSQSRESDKVVRGHSDLIDDLKVIEQTKNLLMFGNVEVEAKAKKCAVVDLYNKICL